MASLPMWVDSKRSWGFGRRLPIPPRLPWSGGEAARQWARRLLPLSGDASEPRNLLEISLRERPLYAPTWLDLGELLASSGDREGAARSIRVARALWPERATLQQRAAWMLVAFGPPDTAFAALMDYWAIAPQDGLRTLGLARRLEPAPEALVDAAAQVWSSGPNDALVYQRGLLDLARRAGDPALAQALWARLDDKSRALEDLLFPYPICIYTKISPTSHGVAPTQTASHREYSPTLCTNPRRKGFATIYRAMSRSVSSRRTA